jgi:genome maintenance exonuclease 1
MSKLFENFVYQPLTREDGGPNGRMYVTPTGEKLPSVTTILSATESQDTREGLEAWRTAIGHKKAQEITEAAATRGTRMHSYLERWVKEEILPKPTNPLAIPSWRMAQVVIDQGLPNVDQFWGVEIPLYYSGLYAGTTDAVGMWKGRPAVLDFKQSNKVKTRDKIDNYLTQLSAYICAHDHLYNTQLECGVILMCVAPKTSADQPQYLEFILDGDELIKYKGLWWERVMKYYMQTL